MLTIEALRHYNVGFEIGDMFGKGRMKELIFNFKEQLADDQGEIERWRQIAAQQAEVINGLYSQIDSQEYTRDLLAKNAELVKKLDESLERESYLQKYVESLEKNLEEIKYSDTEVYRILSSMRANKNLEYVEVS